MIETPEITLGKILGQGSFGKVYKGTWNKLDVAIKIIKTNDTDETEKKKLEDSLYEIKIHKTLIHQHITKFYDVTQLNGSTAIITEYAENGSLASLLENKEFELDWDTRWRFAK